VWLAYPTPHCHRSKTILAQAQISEGCHVRRTQERVGGQFVGQQAGHRGLARRALLLDAGRERHEGRVVGRGVQGEAGVGRDDGVEPESWNMLARRVLCY